MSRVMLDLIPQHRLQIQRLVPVVWVYNGLTVFRQTGPLFALSTQTMRFSPCATVASFASLAFAVPAKRQASSSPAGASTATVSAVPGPAIPSSVPAPAGGIGFNTTPTYKPMSDFDFQSLNLGLHQELIELDLFHYGLAQFSSQDFEAAGLTPSDQYLIQFMADQEVGHATIFENFLAR